MNTPAGRYFSLDLSFPRFTKLQGHTLSPSIVQVTQCSGAHSPHPLGFSANSLAVAGLSEKLATVTLQESLQV